MDQLQKLVSQFGPTRIGVAIAGVVVLYGLMKLLARPKANPATGRARCGCGWSGTVSRFKPTCPRCARSLTLD